MHVRKHKAGEVLFRKGDVADEIVYVANGKLSCKTSTTASARAN
jgi:CRP-like cAMP-binding protein